MKKKLLLAIIGMSFVPLSNSQIVFEKDVYPSSDPGDIVFEDIIISEVNDSSDLISAGYYQHRQDSADASFWAVLSSTDTVGNGVFNKKYQEVDSLDNPYNTKIYDVEEYDGGYIMVGSVQNNSYHGTSVVGGGRHLYLKSKFCRSSPIIKKN